MILSAKFGDGKTFFLQKIRESDDFLKEYKIFTLYPVNYQVAQNEDVFEYIKRDILLQLDKEHLLPHVDIDGLIDSVFTLENLKDVLAFLMSFVPGGSVYEKMMNKILQSKKEYEDRKATIKKYNASFAISKGGLYEEDAYTKMIREALNYLRNRLDDEGGAKKSVLIIEDLDRLDPAHLFRILNVVSAHIDDDCRPDKVGNKFGFDKIVLVMDYEVTRYIFEHFYGKNASYEGYMSKFISDEPFRYSLRELAINKFKNVLSLQIGFPIDYTWFEVLNKKISNYSIRDMNRICSIGYNTRVKGSYIEIHQIKFSTNLPIFRFLVYMAEMGFKETELIECLNTTLYPDKNKWLAMMYPVYLVDNYIVFHSFEDKTGTSAVNYNVNFQMDEDIIVGINCTEGYTYNSKPVSVGKDLEKHIMKALEVFPDCIMLSSLNRNA